MANTMNLKLTMLFSLLGVVIWLSHISAKSIARSKSESGGLGRLLLQPYSNA
jgi:hypothetical protein